MNNVLKLIFIPYLGLGMFMGVACSKHSAWHPGWMGFLILGVIHVVLLGAAFPLAAGSKQKGIQLSPSGLSIGLALAHIAGWLIVLYGMRT